MTPAHCHKTDPEPIRAARRMVLVLLALASVLAPPAWAGRNIPGRMEELDPKARQALQRLEQAYEGLSAYRARIVETRSMSLLAEEQELTGTMVYAEPGRVRWEYREPEHRIYVMKGDTLRGWIPQDRRVERVDLGRYRSRVDHMLGLDTGAKGIVNEFEVRIAADQSLEGADHLVLEPRARRVREKIARVHMWIDVDDGLLRRLGYEVPPGDRVTIDFVDIERDPPVSPGTFELDVPEDARVVEGKTSFGIPGLTGSD